MNSSYFTEEHQLFREFKRFFTKEVVPHIENGKKREQLNASYGKVRRNGLFKLSGYMWVELRFVLHRDFSRRTSKIKSSGFAAAMWAHSYLAMTHLMQKVTKEKQDYLVPILQVIK
jgi:hypothetical protein